MLVALENQEIRVRGIVQGVGFRPTVYRLARECELHGEVFNDTDGVLIRISGIKNNIQQFLQRLSCEAPPLSKIDSIESKTIVQDWHYRDFKITPSNQSEGITEISADAATCRYCLQEINDPEERRYAYPFTNCTHCGPRLSIVHGIPYDRKKTTMSEFSLCNHCREEYKNPLDRRFHAQPIACHECGPQLFIHTIESSAAALNERNQDKNRRVLLSITESLIQGKIVAIKGIGGFHLCCDASNQEAVSLLRERKQRYAKPFALMCHDLTTIQNYCDLSPEEIQALESSAAPIVLLQRKNQPIVGKHLPDAIAPNSQLLGVMLPYTPLHSLICAEFSKPLVMTSGNLSGEPQIIDNTEAIEKLSAIADLIVYHNRDIANRIDDSVVRVISGKLRILRRARGYAPRAIKLPEGFESADNIIAYGAELKSTFCLVKKGTAILSQHQGDLEDLTTANDYEKNMALYKSLFELTPRHLACDLHPDYLSTKLAELHGQHQAIDCIGIQHHHAHIASAMAENRIPLTHPKVLGVALDGLGFGDDNSLWGGEFLLANYTEFQRLARLKPTAMPGGVQAIKQPWRNTFAQIVESIGWDNFSQQFADTELAAFLQHKPIPVLQAMVTQGYNSPVSSSMGRLFDAVAGAIGICPEQVYYEGQAAIELEMLVDADAILEHRVDSPYAMTIVKSENSADTAEPPLFNLDPTPLWPTLLSDLQRGVSSREIATRFHAGLIQGVMHMIDLLHQKYRFDDVVLSGGCLQNATLLQALEQAIQARQMRCITHALVPANDGGIALGQAAIAAAQLQKHIHQPTLAKNEEIPCA